MLASDAGLDADEIARIAEGPDAPGWSPSTGPWSGRSTSWWPTPRSPTPPGQALAAELDAQQLMDLVFTVGAYDVLAMAFRSFGVELDDDLRSEMTFSFQRRMISCPKRPDRRSRHMPHFAKPAEGSWTEHYPELGTGPVSYEDSISPEHYELEREAIFGRTWLNVGRVEQLPRAGSYFTKELDAAGTSVVVVRGIDGEVRAFHNICRHRGNKLVWNDFPARRPAAPAASSPASTTGGATTSKAR